MQAPASTYRRLSAHSGIGEHIQAPASTILAPESATQGPPGFGDDNGDALERYNAFLAQEEEKQMAIALEASLGEDEDRQRDLARYEESERFAVGNQERLEDHAHGLRSFSSGGSN